MEVHIGHQVKYKIKETPNADETGRPVYVSELVLADVITHLKRCGYPLENSFVSYFSPTFKSFINCGLDPIPQSIKLFREEDLDPPDAELNMRKLTLRFRTGVKSQYLTN